MESTGPIVSEAVREWSACLRPADPRCRPDARVARVLHDDLQQQLHAIGLQLALAAEHANAGDLDLMGTRLELARRWLRDSIGTIRQLCAGVETGSAGGGDVVMAVQAVAAEASDRFGLRLDVRIDPSVGVCPSDAAAVLADAARELLFNVVKHAACDEARLELRAVGGIIELTVADHGRGPEPDDRTPVSATGLVRLRRAVEVLGGTLVLDVNAVGGWTAVVRLPSPNLPD
jgi:signal transduction histidine kinase